MYINFPLTKKKSIAIVPDRFALYRYPVFKAISNQLEPEIRVVIYADTSEDSTKVKIVNSDFCNDSLKDGGIRWRKIKSFYVKHVCVWQTGLIRLALLDDCRVIIYWGEANRLSTWVSATLARCVGKKVVFWTHGLYGNENIIKRVFRTWFYKLADVLLLYGEYGKKNLSRVGIPSNRMFVINNSLNVERQINIINKVDVADLQLLRNKFCPNFERLLIFVGRLEKSKRLDLLFYSLVRLKKQGIRTRAILIGTGSQEASLRSLAKALSILDSVIFWGECYDDDKVLPILSISDVCVSPGEVGLTAMHSLICGTPVITHNDFSEQMPEFEAIKPGKNGFFFRRGDVEDLTEKICDCFQAIDAGRITKKTCCEVIEKYYTPKYQKLIFYRAIFPLLFG
ncbi:glycosyltransferase [Microbulbifer thermotolerans]|uniref:glycosyltransferase n=1 Tax=Microbulbifer thermotolerans TaxID=252514 RepID=UPI00224A905F|nr:glycosyltransferase [Microbulbifer thermotolerans]MCX2840248.1 glycosyltransferase [Microbulbifer thermotolerans]